VNCYAINYVDIMERSSRAIDFKRTMQKVTGGILIKFLASQVVAISRHPLPFMRVVLTNKRKRRLFLRSKTIRRVTLASRCTCVVYFVVNCVCLEPNKTPN